MDDPTPAELARAKKWASMQRPPVTVKEIIDQYGVYFCVRDVPLCFSYLINGTFDTADAVWSALALALRPVFASLAPVIAEEERERCAKMIESGHFLHDQAPTALFAKEAAAAIRALPKRGETV